MQRPRGVLPVHETLNTSRPDSTITEFTAALPVLFFVPTPRDNGACSLRCSLHSEQLPAACAYRPGKRSDPPPPRPLVNARYARLGSTPPASGSLARCDASVSTTSSSSELVTSRAHSGTTSYFNASRPHQGLKQRIPVGSATFDGQAAGAVRAIPITWWAASRLPAGGIGSAEWQTAGYVASGPVK